MRKALATACYSAEFRAAIEFSYYLSHSLSRFVGQFSSGYARRKPFPHCDFECIQELLVALHEANSKPHPVQGSVCACKTLCAFADPVE
jgi:hypothetical protein